MSCEKDREVYWRSLKIDQEIFDRELENFVPPRVFDAHAHLYEQRHYETPLPSFLAFGPDVVGWDVYREQIKQILPRREVSGLFFGYPKVDMDVQSSNDFVIAQVRNDAASRAHMLVKPSMEPEFIRDCVRREDFVGLKCYHVFANERPTDHAPITSFLPEEHVRIAHEEGLTITLHIVRPRALADPSNQELIRGYAERYENARFILAHAARGFNPHHTVMGISALRGLRNIWFDTSAITEGGALEAIARACGVDRILYGSDFPISHQRGRCLSLGDSFIWLTSENTNFNNYRGEVQPTMVGIESLRALKLASMHLSLTDSEVEEVFSRNAEELFAGKWSGSPMQNG